jgi:hypothetical protein
MQCRSDGWGWRGTVERLTGETKSGEVVQVVDGELAPVTDVGDGVVGGVLRTMANPNPWSLTTGASRGDGDARLESTAASVIVGEFEMLQQRAG